MRTCVRARTHVRVDLRRCFSYYTQYAFRNTHNTQHARTQTHLPKARPHPDGRESPIANVSVHARTHTQHTAHTAQRTMHKHNRASPLTGVNTPGPGGTVPEIRSAMAVDPSCETWNAGSSISAASVSLNPSSSVLYTSPSRKLPAPPSGKSACRLVWR